MQPPWENETTQPWLGFYDLLSGMFGKPGSTWSVRSLFRPLMTLLAPENVDSLYSLWYTYTRRAHSTAEEVLLADLSMRTTYARTLISSGYDDKSLASELIENSEILLDILTNLVREVDDLDGIRLRPALELDMARLEIEATTLTVPGNQINHSLRASGKDIWVLACKNHDLVTQADSLRIQRMGAVLGYGFAGDLSEILLDRTEDMVANVIAITDRILSAYEVVTPHVEEGTDSDTAATKTYKDRLSYLLNQPWLVEGYEMWLDSSAMTTPMLMLRGSVARLMLAELRGGKWEVTNAKERILKASQEIRWPLHCLAGVRYIGGAQHLLEHGVQPNTRDDEQQTPLSIAIKARNVAMVNLLIEWGANINAEYMFSEAPLLLATEKGSVGVVKALLDHGAEVNVGDVACMPLLIAAETRHSALVKLLLDRGAEVDGVGAPGYLPLHIAAKEGHEVIVKLLLDSGADINAKGHNGWTSLSLAAWKGHRAVVKLLLDRGADIDAEAFDYRIPLLYAAQGGHESVARLLLSRGANINAKDSRHQTPLLAAVKRGHETVVRLLQDCGADVDVRDSDGRTPLFFAVAQGNEMVVKLLLGCGTDVDAKNKDGQTPLFFAATLGNEVVVKLLLDCGTDVDAKDKDGQTPLFFAAMQGNEAVVKLLLGCGTDVNGKDKDGKTPLFFAAAPRNEAVVKLLLGYGAESTERSLRPAPGPEK
jgi:ankyrin repeat protein